MSKKVRDAQGPSRWRPTDEITALGHGPGAESIPIPAASVALLRPAEHGFEALFARRRDGGAFGGLWVFPGGRVDAADAIEDRRTAHAATRRAGAREVMEEVSIAIDPDDLVPLSSWLAPPEALVRFAATTFLGRAPADAIAAPDGIEIREARWLTPASALELHATDELPMSPPTWISVHRLSQAASLDEALERASARGVEMFHARLVRSVAGDVALLPGDAAEATGDLNTPGPRHRVVMPADAAWRYERT